MGKSEKNACFLILAEWLWTEIVFVNRPVDPGSTQGSHRPISFMNKDRTRERPTIQLVELSINNHIVDLIH